MILKTISYIIFICLIIIFIYDEINTLKISDFANNIELYNIVKNVYPEIILECSIKIKNGVTYKNRYSMPIFDYDEDNFKIILDNIYKSNLINKNNKKLINNFAEFTIKNKGTIILGIDENNFKIYGDMNEKIICLIFKNNIVTYKYYYLYSNIYNNNLINIYKFMPHNLKKYIDNNVSHIYNVNDNEYHIILSEPYYDENYKNYVFVISLKENEVTFYYRNYNILTVF